MDKLDVQSYAVQSLEELRTLVGTPHEAVVKKSIGMISDEAKRFIDQSPMMFLSTSSLDGACDVSPRGDKPGFVHVANPQQLVIPERPGNKRVDSLCNILDNPHVGLLFIIPGFEAFRDLGAGQLAGQGAASFLHGDFSGPSEAERLYRAINSRPIGGAC
ncbi:pyridoxamine 5'-phosphate oxidase family protein [Paenibacillus sp. YN15]|uniref:pyridoxamine 5'-phosphate oxidase family protein n=1 Tax=Paenibacillus sp. YN15 TaxID=1742774 RepID=UPI0026C6F4BC|nr:pyridoxamine 5'-phosphate oxidase family protein [Paenibacillus sp. YN15]